MKNSAWSLPGFAKDVLWPLVLDVLSFLRFFLIGLGLLVFIVVLYIGGALLYLNLFVDKLLSCGTPFWRYRDFYSALLKSLAMVIRLGFKVEILGTDNVPKEDKAIIAARHRDILDIPFMAFPVWPKRIVKFVAREDITWYKYFRVARRFIIPIDREDIDKSQLRNILKARDKEELLGYFPEGTRYIEKKHSGSKAKAYGGIFRIADAETFIVPLNIKAGKFYGNDWLKALWGRFARFKVKVKLGEPLKFSEIEALYCKDRAQDKVTKEKYPQLADYFLEEIVDQV